MELWMYPYQVHKTTVHQQLEIAYVDEGRSEKVLLFLHGLGSNLRAWQKNIDALSKHFRCIAIDLPGYGKSEKNNFAFNMTFFSQAVSRFLETLKLEKVILVGHSMGGQIAAHLVLHNEKRVQKLILVAPAGFETFSKTEQQWFHSIYQPSLLRGLSKQQIINNFHLNFYDMPTDAQFMIEDRLLMCQSVEHQYFCKMIPKCVKGMLNEPIFEALSTIKLPTLILYGENDRLIPNSILHPTLSTYQVARQGQQQMTNSQLVMIPCAGHFVQWEQAAQVNQEILQFIVN